MANTSPLVVITGETGSGKSSLALLLAQKFNGEIISADSRAVYRGMDIGTAKPTPSERQLVPHHLLDVSEPDCPITTADYKKLALRSIDDITSRGKLPILVGGSGLYIDAVVYNFQFGYQPSAVQREIFNQMSVEELQALLRQRGINLPENSRNPRHLIRQLETSGQQGGRQKLRENTLMICVQRQLQETRQRIALRVEKMFDDGLLNEAENLLKTYGQHSILGQTIGYQELVPFFKNQCSLGEAKAAIITHSQQYAKRQRTWFRRHDDLIYICKDEIAVDLLTTWLNNQGEQ